MSFEIESKFRLPDQGQALTTALSNHGAVAKPGYLVCDTYLRHPARDFAATGEAFRIRREAGRNMLTYKGPKSGSAGVKTRTEIEFGIDSGDVVYEQARALTTALGFTEVLTVEKFRTPFKVMFKGRELMVVLDNACELGHFAEVETIVETSQEQAAAEAAIKALAAELGLTDSEPRSYLRMWLERLQIQK